MRIRVTGTAEECRVAMACIHRSFAVVNTKGPYPQTRDDPSGNTIAYYLVVLE